MTIHISHHPSAQRVVLSSFRNGVRPVRPVPFPVWLTKNVILVDGPKKGEFWSPEDAPYLPGIAECLSIEHPSNYITVRKAQQTGVSILALAWAMYIAEVHPDNALYAVPGVDTLQDINSAKFQPLIDKWQEETGKRVIFPNVNRSGAGSKTYEKKFNGGSIFLGNANAIMDLSAKTCKYGVKDEVSKWQTLTNGADPETLFNGRFTAFRRTKSYKILSLSTPELDAEGDVGHCRVDRDFRVSDQRFFHINCPECGHQQYMFDENLNINKKSPHKSTFVCVGCGHDISEPERVQALRKGVWIPTVSRQGAEPGFHVDAFISLMMSFEAIAEDRLKAEGLGEIGMKDYTNLNLALPYALKGDAPDHQRLMERREDYKQYWVPAEGLLLVCGVDVQHDCLYVELVAFAPDRQSWSVAVEKFVGETVDPKSGAWIELDEFYKREFNTAYGTKRTIDAMGVDAADGGRTDQVAQWCKLRPNCFAIRGVGGRGVPAIGPPKKISITARGKKKKHGSAEVWPVGNWSIKSTFHAYLNLSGVAAGELLDPPGYPHYGKWIGEDYFKQITAETFSSVLKNGKLREEWVPLRRDNHWLDCRVIATAMAEKLGLTSKSEADWQYLRSQLIPQTDADLLTPVAAAKAPIEPKSENTSQSNDLVSKWAKRR